MAAPHSEAQVRLDALSRLLTLEEQAVREATEALSRDHSPRELEAQGAYLRQAKVEDAAAAMFGRARISVVDHKPGQIAAFDVRPGQVVWLMARDEGGALVRQNTGIVVKRSRTRLEVVLDSFEDALDSGDTLDLLKALDEVTLRRLRDGVNSAKRADGRHARLVELLLGTAPIRPPRLLASTSLASPLLNADQQRAAHIAAVSEDVALVHGPPGTGKTHVLASLVNHLVSHGERVLVMAASHAAVDNLALAVLARDASTPLLRLGHPARAHPDLEAHTLSALTEAHEHKKIARALFDDAIQLLRQARKRSRRGKEGFAAERETKAEAGRLFADARRLERQAAEAVLTTAKVVAATLTAHLDVLAGETFDVLVVDEASQVLTPALLLALPFVKRVVLGGDHLQLPPTVISDVAARQGLADTVFATLCQRDAGHVHSHMLTVQHRMHEDLMRFSSMQFYDGQLVAHETVKNRTLADLLPTGGPLPDDTAQLLRPEQALEFLDTAGSGYNDNVAVGSDSRHNTGEAHVVQGLVQAIIAAGVAPDALGVITPYAGQVVLLAGALPQAVDQGLEIDSVDGFQGREKDVIVFSAVRSNSDGDVGFLSDTRRLNVALTRAKRKLIVVGDSATLSVNATWRAFIDDAMAHGHYRSVFELPQLMDGAPV